MLVLLFIVMRSPHRFQNFILFLRKFYFIECFLKRFQMNFFRVMMKKYFSLTLIVICFGLFCTAQVQEYRTKDVDEVLKNILINQTSRAICGVRGSHPFASMTLTGDRGKEHRLVLPLFGIHVS